VRHRSQLPEAEIARIIASQIPRAERLARADDVIDNGNGPDDLMPQIEQLHRAYLVLAGTSCSERVLSANERQ
jgi:dephospho-CoA kinase